MSDAYSWFKALHVLGVVLLLGSVLINPFWKAMADRTGDPRIIAFAQIQLMRGEIVFTALGAVLVVAFGFAAAVHAGMSFVSSGWLAWGFWLTMAGALGWLAIVMPRIVKQTRLARSFAAGGEIPAAYWRAGRSIAVVGPLLTLALLAALFIMVLKPG